MASSTVGSPVELAGLHQGQCLEERYHSLLILVTGLKNHSGKTVGINKLRQKRNIELSVTGRLLSPVIYLVT